MANTKITALTELAADPVSGDWFVVVDVSDTTQAATGTAKKINASRIANINTANIFNANQQVVGVVTSEQFRTRTDSIADDAAVAIVPPNNIGAFILVTSISGAIYSGLVAYRAAAAGHCTVLAGGASLNSGGTVVLSGNTSTDARFNVSAHPGGTVYFENRTGSTQSVRSIFLC